MNKQNYFAWLSSETDTMWTNDSALLATNKAARTQKGAIGCTTNPPLAYEALTVDRDEYGTDLAAIDRSLSDNEFALEAMKLVVTRMSKEYLPMHKERGGLYGCVRAQVAPNLRDDKDAMLKVGKYMASWGENVMVKIPVTGAGVWVLEELAALGIPTNPTVTTSISQMMAAAEAYERGVARAKAAGIKPAWSTLALVVGRIQDYLTKCNEERNAGLSTSDLEWASVAIIKRANEMFQQNNYACTLQPAAFRAAMQVEQIAGGKFCPTIHPKIQEAVEEADAKGEIHHEVLIDAPIDQEAVDRVDAALPEFALAYEPGAIEEEDFLTFGATVMTLDGFDQGWQKLFTLK